MVGKYIILNKEVYKVLQDYGIVLILNNLITGKGTTIGRHIIDKYKIKPIDSEMIGILYE